MRAFIFPGQGSQYVGMNEKIPDFSLKKTIFDKASEILGYDLYDTCSNSPMDKLTSTEIAQPAIFTVSFAYIAFLTQREIKPDVVAGHSLGEYSALVTANVLSFEDGLKLVQTRGLLMKEASQNNPGRMLAVIGLSEDKLGKVLDKAKNYGEVVLANINTFEQVVLSGELNAINEAHKIAKEEGAKIAKLLDVSAAFHSPLMEPVVEEMSKFIDSVEFKTPEIPVVQNVTGTTASSIAGIKENLKKQLVGPVKWVNSVLNMQEMGVDHFIEVGPKNVLKNMLEKIIKDAKIEAVESLINA
jgi:[acyl-carrier-protein] S-malonyltransferase